MQDPKNPINSYSEFETAGPSSDRKIPTAAWIGGGALVLLLCCVGVVCGMLFLAQDEIGSAFEEIIGTLESSDGSSSTETSELPAETRASSGPLRTDPTVEISPLDPDSGPSSDVDWLYIAEFERSGGWADGEVVASDGTIEAEGVIENGVFNLTAFVDNGIYWTSPSERFDDGIYEVEATAVAGPENNGFGLMFFIDEATNDFYLFEISSDGYVWIGFCANGCDEVELLVDDGWFESELIRQGLGNTNRLTVEVVGGEMRFMINGQEAATATDTRLTSGDMGLLVETFDEGDVRVQFDNAAYAPLP